MEECLVKRQSLAQSLHWKTLAKWAALVAEVLAVAGILAMAFTAGNYFAVQKAALQAANYPGIFEGHGDVGSVSHAGFVEYDAAKKTYTISASGENMWSTKDAFHFAWKKASGDVAVTADISFLGQGAQEHRKAVLMVRQSLDADSAYADVALHGNGLTSLQYRDEKSANTHEIQANISAPKRLRLIKRGAYFSMWLADENGKFQLASGSTRIALQEPFYVGIGVCSHDDKVVERAVFSNVEVKTETPRRITQKSPSYLHGWSPDGKTVAFVGQRNGDFEVYAIPAAGGEETRLTTAKGLDDGPEYTHDGKYIYFNSERTSHMQIWRMKADGSEQEQVTFGEENDWFPHISPDGQWMVFLTYDKSVTGHPANKDISLRLMNLAGLSKASATSVRPGEARNPSSFKDAKITVLAKLFGGQGTINVPSWSPDGTQLAFVSYQVVPK